MNERIKVVLLEPDREAKIAEIETTLESMQHRDCSGESFGSLNDEQLARYQKQFRLPEYFFRSPLGIAAVPYVPAV